MSTVLAGIVCYIHTGNGSMLLSAGLNTGHVLHDPCADHFRSGLSIGLCHPMNLFYSCCYMEELEIATNAWKDAGSLDNLPAGNYPQTQEDHLQNH